MAAPFFEFSDPFPEVAPRRFYAACGKRALDIVLVLAIAPVVVPIIGLALVLAALDGGNPVYSHMRVGRNGELFRCWKIRTMVPNADAALKRILEDCPDLRAEWLQNQKLRKDPRITWIGVLLRRTSLDELPQLWNVLCGSMSLVGPRPFLPEQAGLYFTGRQNANYYTMRPGITGLWQVSRRSRGSFAERADYDQKYFLRIGLASDLMILARTAGAVVRATGV